MCPDGVDKITFVLDKRLAGRKEQHGQADVQCVISNFRREVD